MAENQENCTWNDNQEESKNQKIRIRTQGLVG